MSVSQGHRVANPKDELVELQHTLYASSNPTRRWLHRSRRDWVIAAITKWGAGAERALEIGPGSGVYLPTLARVATSVVASDIETAYLERLGSVIDGHANVYLASDDITRSSFRDASFDLVLCSEVVEHIEDSQRALAEISRLLRPKGVLILSTPQRFSPLELCAKVAFLPGVIRIVRRVYGEPVLETGHLNLLTKRQLRAQLATARLVVRASHTAGVYVPVVAELLGQRAVRLEKRLEARLRTSRFGWLLWTQFVIAERAPDA
jgi:2-polyprenyl-3-methyl-5-hydroxy-6-metoxy-1,4-benzoquinol methylase